MGYLHLPKNEYTFDLKYDTNAISWFDSSSPSDGYYGHCDLI